MNVRLSRSATRQIDDLVRHYLGARFRPEAASALVDAVGRAEALIRADPLGGQAYPRPYPGLEQYGARWILVGSYWIGWFVRDGGAVITNVIHAAANIPGRLSRRPEDGDE